MRVAISAMDINISKGKDIRAIDPIVLERHRLNDKLKSVTTQILSALNYTEILSSKYDLTKSSKNWINSLFNGVDKRIDSLFKPSTSNSELKKGIKRLEELVKQYNSTISIIEKEERKFSAYYKVYCDASKALGEPVKSIDSFKNIDELDQGLKFLEKRSEKAQKCAEIYQILGPKAYICYAWDQELQALGYSLYTRKEIVEKVKYKPIYAHSGDKKIPFYQWNNNELTQLYSLTSSCSLQLIVHANGSVSMQTLSDRESIDVRETQKNHCAILTKLYENLRNNWFVCYSYQEVASSAKITSFSDWLGLEDCPWKSETDVSSYEQRKRKQKVTQVKLMKDCDYD